MAKANPLKEAKISVIIPNWNGRRLLKMCLDSLREQTFSDFRTIIIDNGSSDKSVEFVRRYYPEVEVIRFNANRGFSIAVNAGINATENPYVAVLNNDVRVDKNWLFHLNEALDKNPHVGFCACKMLNLRNQGLIDSVGNGYTRQGVGSVYGFKEKDVGQYDYDHEVFGACAGAAIYRREMLDRIGLFDENYFSYLEDVDLSVRARLFGYRCLYVHKAVVYHLGSASTGETIFNPIKVRLLVKNYINTLVKNMPLSIMVRCGNKVVIYLFILFVYYGFRRMLKPFFHGLLESLLRLRTMLKKRKSVLEGRILDDYQFFSLLKDSERRMEESWERRLTQGVRFESPWLNRVPQSIRKALFLFIIGKG